MVPSPRTICSPAAFGDRMFLPYLTQADDMGYNDIGYTSNDLTYATENLDKLSQDGVILDRYYTQQSCTPARVAFLTGRYPAMAGMGYDVRGSFVAVSPYGVPLSINLLPEYLTKYGYRCAMVGKWNIGHHEENYLPHRRGFESSLTFQSDEMHYWNYTVEPRLNGLAPVDLLLGSVGEPFKMAKGEEFKGYSSYMFARRAIEEINLYQTDKRNMFLYVAFQAVHVPHDEPPVELYNEEEDGWKLSNISRPYRQHFGRTLIALDKSVKRIVDELQGSGIMDNTFLVVASDNGGCPSDGSNNFPLRGGKFDVFEGGVHVPAFIYSPLLPDSVKGSRLSNLFHVTDWLPTFLKIAAPHQDLPGGIDGVSQLEAIYTGDAKNGARDEVLLGLNRWSISPFDEPMDLSFDEISSPTALIKGRYKYVTGQVSRGWFAPNSYQARNCSCGVKTTPIETFLFDLMEDPKEENNLILELPDIALSMKLKLRGYYDSTIASVWKPPEQDLCIAKWNRTGYMIPWHKPKAEIDETWPLPMVPDNSPEPGDSSPSSSSDTSSSLAAPEDAPADGASASPPSRRQR